MAPVRFGLLVLLALPASAVELQIQYSAIQKILAQQVFTQEGRMYVRGGAGARCSYAYLEHPSVEAAGDLIRARARFSGRSALDFFGRCVGLGDSFDLTIVAAPYYRDGVLRLKDVRVESKGHDGFYVRRVRMALAQSLQNRFEYRLVENAKKLLEEGQGNAALRQEMTAFQLLLIRVTPSALVLTLDFTLRVK